MGRAADDVREARPPEQRGSSGDDKQALQGVGVAGHVSSAVQAFLGDAEDAGTGPVDGAGAALVVPSQSYRATGW